MKRFVTVLNIGLYVLLAVVLANGILCCTAAYSPMFGVDVHTAGVAQIVFSSVLLIGLVVFQVLRQQRLRQMLLSLDDKMHSGSPMSRRLDLPIVLCKKGKMAWYNDAFREQVLQGKDAIGTDISHCFSHSGDGTVTMAQMFHRNYRVWSAEEEDGTLYYFLDTTEYDRLQNEYEQTRAVVGLITVDNLDELSSGAKDSMRADMSAAIERQIERWANGFNCILKKLSSDRYLILTDERSLQNLREQRFSILKTVRSLDFGEKGTATLSVGFGHEGDSLEKNEEYARDALEMALGRGGDQVAVKNQSDFSFYGGTATGSAKRSRVRTRVVASSLRKLIEESGSVLIMGHRNADLDAVGSGIGMCFVASRLGKEVHLVVNPDTCLCSNMVSYATRGNPGLAVTPQEAMDYVEDDTLLIITDTHRRAFLESPELFDACSMVAIIDHHRKTVDYIDSAVLFYHEPYASSASEMVTELLPYLMNERLPKAAAEALLAGIMLDTRNFVLHTGARTFEASAYLRTCSASPVMVKSFFQNSIDVFKERAVLVAKAEVYHRCAISFSEHTGRDVMIAASQAADEMLGIDGVDASFVYFNTGTCINVSARSLGAINVQLIMEKLGGGGHLTMAAAQLYDTTLEQAMDRVIGAIDSYRNENA